jgi:hypothetical protein
VVADRIEAVTVQSSLLRELVGPGTEFLVENLIPEPLTGFDLGSMSCLAKDQIATFGTDVWRV